MPEELESKLRNYYTSYYKDTGKDRNDILANPGVLMQTIALQKSIIEALRTVPLRPDWKILDVGCGTGNSLSQFLSYGIAPSALHGIEMVPERIEKAREAFSGMKFVCGDASKMEYETASFDLVLESTMFMTLTDDKLSEGIAAEMLRVTRPGGYIMLADWRYDYGSARYKALSRKRMAKLFNIETDAAIHCVKKGALVPPIGRFLSAHAAPLYFLVQAACPFLAAQTTTILRKTRSAEHIPAATRRLTPMSSSLPVIPAKAGNHE